MDLILFTCKGIPNGKDARIEDANDITRIGCFYGCPFLCHELLGLGKLNWMIALEVPDGHALLKFAGANAHKTDTVAMGRIHVGLDFKNEGAKILIVRHDDTAIL